MCHDASADQVDATPLGRRRGPCGSGQGVDRGRRGHRDEVPGELVVGGRGGDREGTRRGMLGAHTGA